MQVRNRATIGGNVLQKTVEISIASTSARRGIGLPPSPPIAIAFRSVSWVACSLKGLSASS